MLDTYIAQFILNEYKIAYLVTNKALMLVETGGNFPVMTEQLPLQDIHLLDVAPEFVGYEEQLNAILVGTLPRLRLHLVNREDQNGDAIYVTLSALPYKNAANEICGILHLVEDTTNVGEANQHITQQRNELYLLHRELSDSNLRLAAANAELRALDELKSRFVSIAAHELRTPLASLQGYVDFLLQDEDEPLTETQRKSLRVVKRGARRLYTITSDLLDITRLETGRLELFLERVNLPALTQAVITEFRPELRAKQLSLTLTIAEALPPALCDEKRSLQILNNLLSNAIKYTLVEGKVHLQLQTNQAEDAIIFSVTDTGIGIPAADLNNLGKAFFRASNVHKARVSGTGLGLHITQSLAELQGGELCIESKEGEGSTFSVSFPIDDGVFAL